MLKRKFKNSYFVISILLFQISFRLKYISGFRILRGTFWIKNFVRKQFLKWIRNGKKTPASAKIVQKWLLAAFAILTVERSNKNDCKLDEIPRNF